MAIITPLCARPITREVPSPIGVQVGVRQMEVGSLPGQIRQEGGRGCVLRSRTIVIPVFNAFPDALACLRSVLECTEEPYRILAIDDASSDGVLANYLPECIAGDPHVEIVRNPTNLGFVKSCNLGMRMSAPSDVVLLNSDVEVTPRWLSKLAQAAESNPWVGTVTPLTNNGEICSIPKFMNRNELPPNYTLHEFAALVERASARLYPELPTCVGFCVYINRRLLDKIGLFDEEQFGRGYGEENDLSCRAQAAGFHDVLDDSTFVLHKGGRSFAADAERLMADNLRVLEAKHPRYSPRIQQFVTGNPLREVHGRIHEAMLRRWNTAAEYRILHVLHNSPMTHASGNLPGGVEYHVADLIATIPNAAHWSLFASGDAYCLRAHVPCGEQSYIFATAGFDLTRLFDRGLFDIVHLHHASKFPHAALAAALRRHGRYFVSLHDFALCCPNIHLLTRDGRLCHGNDSCGRSAPRTQALRATATQILSNARAVFHFSQSTREHYAEHLGDEFPWQLIPHGIPLPARGAGPASDPPPRPGPGSPLRVAFLGGINAVKGARIVREVATRRALASGVPLEWHLVGFFDGTLDSRVIEHGRYCRDELPALLAQVAPHVVVLPSICPETYGFTLDESLACGVPVISTPLGALAERVRQYQCGWILDRLDGDGVLESLQKVVDSWDEYCAVRRRIAALSLSDVRSVAGRYARIYRETLNGQPLSDITQLLGVIDRLSQEYSYRVPWSRRITGRVINGGVRLLDGLRLRQPAVRVAKRLLPIRVKQWIHDLRRVALAAPE